MAADRVNGSFPVRPVVPTQGETSVGRPGVAVPQAARPDQYTVGGTPRLHQPSFRTPSYFGGLTADQTRFDAKLSAAVNVGDRGEAVGGVEEGMRPLLRG